MSAVNVLVSGSTSYQDLSARYEKAVLKKNQVFEVVLCVGRLTAGDARNKDIPIPVYVLGENNESSAKNVTMLKDAGVCTIAGLRVAYLSGGDTRDKVESVLCDGGAYVAGGGVDVLLAKRIHPDLLADLPLSYHFLPGTIEHQPYRVGRGRQRIARVVGLADGKLRAFRISAHEDTTISADEFKAASSNPYQKTTTNIINHQPPPGLLAHAPTKRRRAADNATASQDRAKHHALSEATEVDDEDTRRSSKAQKIDDKLPASFAARGVSSRGSWGETRFRDLPAASS